MSRCNAPCKAALSWSSSVSGWMPWRSSQFELNVNSVTSKIRCERHDVRIIEAKVLRKGNAAADHFFRTCSTTRSTTGLRMARTR